MITQTSDEIISQMELSRTQFKGCFVFVEGINDALLFSYHLSDKNARVLPAPDGGGKRKLEKLKEKLNEQKKNMGLWIIIRDADFDRLEGKVPVNDEFWNDAHDVEMMIFKTAAYEKYLHHTASNKKIERDKIMSMAKWLGYLQWTSLLNAHNLKFESLSYKDFTIINDFTIDLDSLILSVCNKSQAHSLPKTGLKATITKMDENNYQLEDVCVGPHVMEFLALCLSPLKAADVNKGLRLAFENAHFQSTQLFADLKQWGDAHNCAIVKP